MSQPRFKSIAQQVAELAAYAGNHTAEQTQAKLDSLSPAVRRKIVGGLQRRGARDGYTVSAQDGDAASDGESLGLATQSGD